MAIIHRVPLFVLVLTLSLMPGCGGGSDRGVESTAIVLSDIHFNPFYDATLFPALVSAEPGEWAGIFQTSTITTPAGWGADTNYPLLALTLASIRENLGDSPIVIYTGDLLGHYFATTFYQLLGSEDVAAMQTFADKTAAFVMEQVRLSVGDAPVVFAVGNGDSYTGNGPDRTFLVNTAELYYTHFLRGTADHEAFRGSFESGGYYAAEPLGAHLMVIGLNTIWLSPQFPGDNQSAVDVELAWLDSKLAEAQAGGKTVWLIMHVPPGGDLASTAQLVDGSGDLPSDVMMLYPHYQAALLAILANYPGLITLTFAGHTHMDEYRIASGNVIHVSPGISPVFGNNPAYKIFTFSPATTEAADYTALRCDLAAPRRQFNEYYVFSSAYSTHEPLDQACQQLFTELAADGVKQTRYRTYYYSGPTPANPITNTNWPVYWCGIASMGQQALLDCANSHAAQEP